MHVQLMSDLHLEIERGVEFDYDRFEIPTAASTLALLGDIGVACDGRLFPFLRNQLKHFDTILYVLGNHESYRSTYVSGIIWFLLSSSLVYSPTSTNVVKAETVTTFEQLATDVAKERGEGAELGEFVFLNRKAWSPPSSPNTVILGCTLWSQLNPDDLDILSWGMTDFKLIDGMTAEAYDDLHIQDARWLDAELKRLSSEPDKTVIVLTHHAPIVEGGSDPKFSGPGNPTASGFVSDMANPATGLDVRGQPRNRDALLAPPISLWAFGHTHWCCDFVLPVGDGPGIRLVSNQRGYKHGTENRAMMFNKELVLEL